MMIQNDWLREPDGDGEWLWVTVLPCGCCFDESGLCEIYNGKRRFIGEEPTFISFWLKLPEMPEDYIR